MQLIEEKMAKINESVVVSGTKNIFIDLAIDLMRRGHFSWQNVEDESNVIVFGVSTLSHQGLLILSIIG